MSYHEINLAMQTFWTTIVLVSMYYRAKANYLVHAVTMIVVIAAAFASFSLVLFMSPLGNSSFSLYLSSPMNLAVSLIHSVLSAPALLFGTWLVLLWRPKSTNFADRSKQIAKLALLFWVSSYVAGVLAFLVLHTTIFR